MSPKGLFAMFSNFGVVKDVYIPDKRRKETKTKFGFVRYDCSFVVVIAIQKANGVWCGDKTLKVKKVDFGKEKDLTNTRTEVQKPGGGTSFISAGIRGRSSYVEVLKGGKIDSGNNISIKAEEYAVSWLLLAAVIKFKPRCKFDDFKTEWHNRGLKDIQLREGGGRNAFVTFKSQVELQQALNNPRDWLLEWCDAITQRKKGMRLDNERLVLLSCFGMPQNLWNVTNFRKIGDACGEVVQLDHNVMSMESLKCGKIRICTSQLERIDKLVILE
ncbi:hypothetical protein ACSBR1_018724 [Camellia fascicularis]